jgi:hypothetical protein
MSANKIVRGFVWSIVCFLGVLFLLAREFVVGQLSPRGFGVAVLILMLAGFFGFVVLLRRGASIERQKPPPAGPADEATRKRRILWIKLGKIFIAVLAIEILGELIELRNAPLAPLVERVVFDVIIIAIIVRAIGQTKKSLC